MPTVILTGADGNVGTIVRQVLASRGWSVIGLDKDQADITDLSSVQDFIKTLDTPLSAVIHLVGGIDAGKSIEDADPSTLQRMLDLNVLTTYIMMHSCIPLLREAGGGCFVAMGAQSVQHPVPNRAAYSASKSAVVSLIQSLAEEGREHGIRANAILPSIIHTPANLEWASEEEAAKWPTREDVGKVIGDLIDQRSPVTGAVIPLYGKIPF